MTFNKPTNKNEMYEILQSIFHYYRIEREGYSGTTLEELNLEKMQFTPLSEAELLEKAETLLGGEHQKEIRTYKRSLESEKAGLNAKLTSLNQERDNANEKISAMYETSEEQVEKQAMKNGLINSSIVTDKIAMLETAKNDKIAQINLEYADKISNVQSEIEKINALIEQAEEYFSSVHQKEKTAKALELKDKQKEIERTVFKYNNSLDEKIIKYHNSIAQSNVELKLKYMEIQAGEFSKDELVDMGYYDDAIKCVCDYYDTLSPLAAFQDIVLEQRLMIFLDEYYQDAIYMYKIRAGA